MTAKSAANKQTSVRKQIIYLSFPACSTHIYPLQVTVGHRGGDHGVVGVDDGDNVHPQQLVQRAAEVAPLLLVVEVQVGHQDLPEEDEDRPEGLQLLGRKPIL